MIIVIDVDYSEFMMILCVFFIELRYMRVRIERVSILTHRQVDGLVHDSFSFCFSSFKKKKEKTINKIIKDRSPCNIEIRLFALSRAHVLSFFIHDHCLMRPARNVQ